MTNPYAMWQDDSEQESLFEPNPVEFYNAKDYAIANAAPAASSPATPGSVEAIKQAPREWAPPAGALLRDCPLADLFRLKAEYKIRVGHQTGDMDAAVLALTPAEGWPGKNAEQRADARALAIAGAEHIRNIQRLLDESTEFLTRIDAEINAREAELTDQKRAIERLEWDIRAREIQLRRDELDHARAVFTAAHPEIHP